MAEDNVYVGSRLRVWLPAINVTPDGEAEFEPAALTVEVYGPLDTSPRDIGTLGEEGGVSYLDFEEGELDRAGIWTVNAEDDGFKARIKFRVEE